MLYRSIYPQLSFPTHEITANNSLSHVHPVKFPEDIQIILRSDRQDYGNLYIGNIEAALNTQLLEKLKIDAILSVAEGSPIKHPQTLVRYCNYIPISDDQTAEISQQIYESVAFLENSLLVTNVLVHCISGGWRSAVPLIAYLIKSRKLSSEDAEAEVKNRRRIIDVSDDIRHQLKKYELDLNNTSPRKSKYNYSMRVQTKKSHSPFNESYFDNYSQKSRSSAITGGNDPKNISIRAKSHHIDKSKSFAQEGKLETLFHQPKMHTKAENPEYSCQDEPKKWMSMVGLQRGSFHKTKSSRVKMISEAPSLGSYHEPIQIQPLNSQGSDIYPLKMMKKRSKSRQQFENRLKVIDMRNMSINNKFSQIQDTFEKTTEANKLLLECQLKELKMIEEQIIRQHQGRFNSRKKRIKTSKNSQGEQSFQNQSMISQENESQRSSFSSFSKVQY